MNNSHYLQEIVTFQKQGIPQGICSICSANPFVIEAALEHGLQENTAVLIELRNLNPPNGGVRTHTGCGTIVSSADVDARSVTNNATASGGGETSPRVTYQIACPYPPSGWVIYVIQSGDTLYSIGEWYKDQGVTYVRLMQANCLSSTNIRTGQNLYVPSPPPPATVSGLVYYDTDHDNSKDYGEDGIRGLTLVLVDLSTNAIITTKTKDDGTYDFTGLKPGNYRIYQRVITISRPGQVVSGVDFALHSVPPP